MTHYRTPQLAIGKRPINTTGSLAWFLPLGAALIFGSIFVLANPDVLDWVSHRISRVLDRMSLWLGNVSVWEVLFCILALLLGAGLMRPLLPILTTDRIDPTELAGEPTAESPLFAAFRNTLLTLIALFTVYLLFEFATLWKRDFPEGFYYAGYAHQGAAWLTCALALATVLLSVMFSGTMLRDPRVGSLRRLAWVWSVANLLLAAAVYNRLLIYVGYNGMTRMRSVGFFGITVVVIGFVLVLYKIRSQRNFWWLVRTQLIALVLTIITYSVFPVDYVMHRYNANAISAGYLRPAVMVAVKPIGNEGYFPLIELVDSDDEIIRNGVRAMLAEKQLSLENAAPSHWTRWQWSAQRLRDQLQEEQTRWSSFADPAKRDQAIERFRDYAMQWY